MKAPDIRDWTDKELKEELPVMIKELKDRDIPFCSKCGATEFFTQGCSECEKVIDDLKEIKE